MEENVALDSSKQKQFVKSIKGIKKLIKKNDKHSFAAKNVKIKDGKVQKPKRKPRGLVYLGHIPHGFYEHEMTQYFKQFGVVTNARVIRSKRTGRSKGHAFVEFRDTDVAEVVAETMNNYLMGKRLIKATSIPPENQKRFVQRKRWNAVNNPTNEIRKKMRKAYNAKLDDDGELKRARRMLSTFRKTKKKLNDLGINYDFFSPVDVPEVLLQLLVTPEVKQEKPEIKIDVKAEKPRKKLQTEIPVKSNIKDEKLTRKKKIIKSENLKPKKERVTVAVSKKQKLKLKNAGENTESSEDKSEENSDPKESEAVQVNVLKRKIVKKTSTDKALQQFIKQDSSKKVKIKPNQKSKIIQKKSKFENKNIHKLNKKQFKEKN